MHRVHDIRHGPTISPLAGRGLSLTRPQRHSLSALHTARRAAAHIMLSRHVPPSRHDSPRPWLASPLTPHVVLRHLPWWPWPLPLAASSPTTETRHTALSPERLMRACRSSCPLITMSASHPSHPSPRVPLTPCLLRLLSPRHCMKARGGWWQRSLYRRQPPHSLSLAVRHGAATC